MIEKEEWTEVEAKFRRRNKVEFEVEEEEE
jgi:hypothetical protein